MTLLQILLIVGVVWVAAAVALGLLVGAVAKDPELVADDEDWGWPHRIDDQRRD